MPIQNEMTALINIKKLGIKKLILKIETTNKINDRANWRKAINTNKAPLPVGPYNQAVLVDKTLYISGQVALNPENNELIQGSIKDETHQIMKNIKSILNEAGLNFKNVVRSKIYLTDMNNFSKVNEVYGSYFEKNHEPARTTLEVSGLPLGVDVEIDMIAVV